MRSKKISLINPSRSMTYVTRPGGRSMYGDSERSSQAAVFVADQLNGRACRPANFW